MPRPKVDAASIRAEMMDAAEALLAESAGRRLVLSDIAARMGRSQSYVHSHFRTKHDLIAALAERWFAEVERAVRDADASGDPKDRIRAQVLATLRVKKAKHDVDPALFRAYLTLAAGHPELAQAHTARLTALLRNAIEACVPPETLDVALAALEDATAQFRVPHMIALKPHNATEARARAVLDILLGSELFDTAKREVAG